MQEVLNDIYDITYGWIDKYKQKHTHSKINFFKENYRYMSIEETLKYRCGTCLEMAALIKYLLKEKGYNAKNYMINYQDENKVAKHTICVVEENNKFYLVENSWILEHPIQEFNTLEELLIYCIKRYPKMYKIEPLEIDKIVVMEYDELTVDFTFKECVDYIMKNGKRITINFEF